MMYSIKQKKHIQPFEEVLAARELAALLKTSTDDIIMDRGEVKCAYLSDISVLELCQSLAYWESVGRPLGYAAPGELTRQYRYENTRTSGEVLSRGHRRLRYGPHGLHEYRGKFFPQLVKALINIARLPKGAVVLDPMLGSGTTAVECRLAGIRALGIDVNPLSAFISRVKCRSIEFDANELSRVVADIERRISDDNPVKIKTYERFVNEWFSPHALSAIGRIDSAIDAEKVDEYKDFLKCLLSDILRSVSLQDPRDLRVRRRKDDAPLDVAKAFLQRLHDAKSELVAFLRATKEPKTFPDFDIRLGDARNAAAVFSDFHEGVDAIITSPPYATALPYIDTDRLSLAVLGLARRDEHARLENTLVGSRERTRATLLAAENRFKKCNSDLPRECIDLIALVSSSIQADPSAGFRKRNLPGLLTLYFEDMKEVFTQARVLLKPRSPLFVVVGNNTTTINGTVININTANLLASLARHCGFALLSRLSMDMLKSRDIFAQNAIATEEILHFEKLS